MQVSIPCCATCVRGRLSRCMLLHAIGHHIQSWPTKKCSPFVPTPAPFCGLDFPRYNYLSPLLRISRRGIVDFCQPTARRPRQRICSCTTAIKNSVWQKGFKARPRLQGIIPVDLVHSMDANQSVGPGDYSFSRHAATINSTQRTGDLISDTDLHYHNNSNEEAEPTLKTRKTQRKANMNWSCPFRKRNPMRFNVRDHGACALSRFADIALLK